MTSVALAPDGALGLGGAESLGSRSAEVLARVEAVYRSDHARLWRSVCAFAGSSAVADDAVAEAFAQVIRRGADVLDPRAWVWRTAFRLAAGELQRARRDSNELLVDLPGPGTEPDDVVVLQAELQRLSYKQRASIVLHDYAGYPARDIANMIGSTEAAVRVHVMRARRALRARLASARQLLAHRLRLAFRFGRAVALRRDAALELAVE